MPKLNAIKFAHDITNKRCVESLASNTIGSGHRFGPDQKGCPCESRASGANMPIKSRMLKLKKVSNMSRAIYTQLPKSACDFRLKMLLTSLKLSMAPVDVVCCLRPARKPSGLSIKLSASCALVTNIELKESRPHSMQCSIMLGKLRIVHMGMASSGGSCESP